jgi:hypothetical protein
MSDKNKTKILNVPNFGLDPELRMQLHKFGKSVDRFIELGNDNYNQTKRRRKEYCQRIMSEVDKCAAPKKQLEFLDSEIVVIRKNIIRAKVAEYFAEEKDFSKILNDILLPLREIVAGQQREQSAENRDQSPSNAASANPVESHAHKKPFMAIDGDTATENGDPSPSALLNWNFHRYPSKSLIGFCDYLIQKECMNEGADVAAQAFAGCLVATDTMVCWNKSKNSLIGLVREAINLGILKDGQETISSVINKTFIVAPRNKTETESFTIQYILKCLKPNDHMSRPKAGGKNHLALSEYLSTTANS